MQLTMAALLAIGCGDNADTTSRLAARRLLVSGGVGSLRLRHHEQFLLRLELT
ncbi:MAG: Uncharacterised protein [Prochlorococcus marinus str. MIT 9215]|nr:MAG: Uncharacterised protein [Prochlorococcus marinus str. MIT 9215]